MKLQKFFSPTIEKILKIGSAVVFCAFVITGGAIALAPIEISMGGVQKIFYIHLPSAWCAFLSFFLVFIFGAAYLWKNRPQWDILAESAGELGVLWTTVVLLTGSIWARAAWGKWWTWDVRLTTTLILWFIYVGYIVLRNALADNERMPAYAAAYGVLGFINVPIVYLSVRLANTQHPTVLRASGGGGLEPAMAWTLLISSVAFVLAGALLYIVRVREECLKKRISFLRETITGGSR